MTIKTNKVNEYLTIKDIKIYIGDHTVASHSVRIYTENTIKNLYEEVKQLAKELKKDNPNLVIGRRYTKKDIHSINFELQTNYKRDQEEFLNIVDNLPFLEQDQVTLSEMRTFTSIANKYGRHGSKSYLKYDHIHEAYNHLIDIKNTLKYDYNGLMRIAI